MVVRRGTPFSEKAQYFLLRGPFLVLLVFAMFFANLIFPFILDYIHPDTRFVIGNPKPLYFYDINPICRDSMTNITSSLDYLSDETGVSYLKLPFPVALVIGGISYNCQEPFDDSRIEGEAETGVMWASYFIFIWNNIKLKFTDRTTVLHETLHVMGFGHRHTDSILHPSAVRDTVEEDLSTFIRKIYVNNPWVYLNILPLNLFYIGIIIFFIYNEGKK